MQIDEDASFRVRMIDCVGYIVPSAIGYIEEDQPRMVRTPWYEEPIPFNMAAEIGTKKVITEHSTIGPGHHHRRHHQRHPPGGVRGGRGARHRRAEPNRQALCDAPSTAWSQSAPRPGSWLPGWGEKYSIPVLPVNCIDITEQDIRDIIASLLYQFPVREVALDLPGWVTSLESGHWLLSGVLASPARAPAASTKCARSNPCWNACESVSRSRRCGWAASTWAAAPAGPSWSLTRSLF